MALVALVTRYRLINRALLLLDRVQLDTCLCGCISWQATCLCIPVCRLTVALAALCWPAQVWQRVLKEVSRAELIMDLVLAKGRALLSGYTVGVGEG